MLLPLKVDVPSWRIPIVNYLLIAAIALVSIAGINDSELFCSMAGIKVTTHGDGISAAMTSSLGGKMLAGVTSLFLHSGYIHLVGNLWFLWVFGNAINYKFGQLAYPALFLFAGWVGSMAHYMFTGVPVVGASGAINGVVGAFLVFFPRNDVTMVWALGIYLRRFTLSSYWVILFWFAWDALGLMTGGNKGVALWSHLAGFLAGFTVAITCAKTGLIQSNEDEQTLLEVFAPQKRIRSRY